MKKVFNTREISHIWAQQSQAEGRSQGNIFFNNRIIYSYGYHFPIAAFVNGLNNIVLLNSERYSNTTAKHISYVRNAIPRNCTVFTVPSVGDNYGSNHINQTENINYYVSKIDSLLEASKKARSRKTCLLSDAEEVLQELNLYTETFKLELLHKYTGIQSLGTSAEQIEENKRKIQAENDKKEAQKIKEKKAKINQWKKGLINYIGGLNTVYLRIKDNTVETSFHAAVSTKQALILYRLIQAKKDILGFKLDGYTVLSIDKRILTVGCHHVPLSEVRRIGKELEALEAVIV